jgi:hypothetical protein
MDNMNPGLVDQSRRTTRMLLFGGLLLFIISQCLVAPVSRFWTEPPPAWIVLPNFLFGTFRPEKEKAWAFGSFAVVILTTLATFISAPFILKFLNRSFLPARILSGLMFAFAGNMLHGKWYFSRIEYYQPPEIETTAHLGFWLLIAAMLLNGFVLLRIGKRGNPVASSELLPTGRTAGLSEAKTTQWMLNHALVLFIVSQFFFLGFDVDQLGWYFKNLAAGVDWGWSTIEEHGFQFFSFLAIFMPAFLLSILLRGPWMVDHLLRSITSRFFITFILLGSIAALIWIAYKVHQLNEHMAQIIGGREPYHSDRLPVEPGYVLYIMSLVFYVVGIFLLPRRRKS